VAKHHQRALFCLIFFFFVMPSVIARPHSVGDSYSAFLGPRKEEINLFRRCFLLPRFCDKREKPHKMRMLRVLTNGVGYAD
jgi:hypothetical protein